MTPTNQIPPNQPRPDETATERQPVVIIGIGNALRRDDGVGPLVLDSLRLESLPDCDLVELDGEAARLIEAWSDRELAVIVDAVCTGEQAGTLHDLSLDDVSNVRARTTATSSHYVGLAEALALGQTLDRLPTSLRVLGIEPGDLKQGFGLSPPVAASLEDLIEKVRHAVSAFAGRTIE